MQGKIRMKSSSRRSLVQQEDKNIGSNDGGAAMLIMIYDAEDGI